MNTKIIIFSSFIVDKNVRTLKHYGSFYLI